MASNDGGGDRWQPNRYGSPTQRELRKEHRPVEEADTEQNVAAQTEDVFQNFLHESWKRDSEREDNVGDIFQATPSVSQLSIISSNPLSTASHIGRRLAMIGDDINKKYQREFDGLIHTLNVDKYTVYDQFCGVAQQIMKDGVNWGRIVSLFCFGYRLLVKVVGIESIKNFAQKIVKNVVTFVTDTTQGIARWIAQQGGWISALTFVPSVSWQTLASIAMLAGCTLGIVYYLHSGK